MTESEPLIAQATELLVERTETHLEAEDNLTRALKKVVVPETIGTDHYSRRASDGFPFESMVKLYLYKQIKQYSDAEFERRLTNWPYLRRRFEVSKAPRQQTFSYTWNTRFSPETKRALDAAAKAIASKAVEENVIRAELAPSDPDEETDLEDDGTPTREYKRKKTRRSVRFARKHAIPYFETARAENKSYSDTNIFEILSRMCSQRGSANSESEYAWLADDDYTPDGSTILRAIKQIEADTNDQQRSLEEFDDGRGGVDDLSGIDAIRDAVLEPFTTATENTIASINGDDPFSDRKTVAAIDMTYEQIHISPWEDRDAEIPNESFPAMASGCKEDDEYRRGYKYATLSLVGDTAPIILGIEPVKQNSEWEPDDAPSHTLDEIVDRLLEQAQQYLDLDIVLFDREFYSHSVFNTVDQHDITYITPKMKYETDYANIADIEEHPSANAAVEHDVVSSDSDREHELEFLYVPSREEDGEYAVFATNMDHVAPEEVNQVTNLYRRRWDIEIQYKSIKEFLPRTSLMGFRVRFTNFVFASMIYNLWRLTDYLLKRSMGLEIRSETVIGARTFARAVGNFLQDID